MSINWHDQRGSSEPVGFLGMIPLVLVTTLFMLQVSMFGYTVVVAESAVRDAARAAAIGANAKTAVDRVAQSTGIKMDIQVQCSEASGTVRVDLVAKIPAIVKALQAMNVSRWAVMQLEGTC